MDTARYFSFLAILLCIAVHSSSGLECYSCFNIKGANASPWPGSNYGSGCDAGSLSKDFKEDCNSGKSLAIRNALNLGGGSNLDASGKATWTDCLKMETTIGNITVTVRDCGAAASSYKGKCTTEKLADNGNWNTLLQLQAAYLQTPILPTNANITNSNINICACDKKNCNGAGQLVPQSFALGFAFIAVLYSVLH